VNHLAKIQTEFFKSARRWDDLTLDEQRSYLAQHPKSKHRLTARPGRSEAPESEFDPGKKSVEAFFDGQKQFGKAYLKSVGKVIKTAFFGVDLPEIVVEDNIVKGSTVKFSTPVKIGQHDNFEIKIDLSYPKIRCKHVESDTVLDSQQPNALIKKIKLALGK
jgi:hypothetical protein